jgi:AcrR family transcriptional regulator
MAYFSSSNRSDQLLRATGMLPASLYCHFESKEGMVVAACEQGVNRMLEAVASAVERTRGGACERL